MADRYTIEGELGRGGTAIVYRARDRVRGIDVAIKLLRDDAMSAMSVERFLLEIRQTAKLPHPHIVPVLDSGQIEGRPYFVLPYMDGGTLRERLIRHKQLQFEEVIALGATIARALEFAHAHGVIHRDVKPENILYNNGQPCLADFGTARALERAANDPTTSTGVVRGTAAYMSPEQASGERKYDGRTDIYSLACVLYECVAGIQPFVGPTLQAVISQRLSHAPRPVSVYRPSAPQALEQVLVKATAMTPADRYQRAGELADALELVTPTLTNLRVTPPAIQRRTSRARGWLVGGMTAVAIGLSAFLVQRSSFTAFRSGPPIDTTLIAILPVESTGNLDPMAGQELFIEGLRKWSGVSTVETFSTNDAIRRRGRGAAPTLTASALSIDDVGDLVKSLGAGRFIRSRLTEASGLRGVYATLYDVKSRKDLYHARVPLPADSSLWPGVFAALTDSLILRGAPGAGRGRRSELAPPNLASYQLFLRGRDALGAWDLAAADSLFNLSSQLDSLNIRALLWGAQVRSWRNRSPVAWARAAGVAARDSLMLAPSERLQARALAALGAGDYPEARIQYKRLTELNPYDFAGWYGLATAHRWDRVVLRDSTSISGYRFRASYERAIDAYTKAYEYLPSAHRTVQAGGFEQLRFWLFTGNVLRWGSLTGSPPQTFYARINLDHDTAAFIPYLRDTVLAGPPQTDPAVVGRALTRNRKLFQRLVSSWRASFPASPGTREAVAISMEMLGDPASADSFNAARRTAPKETQLRLAVEEAIVRLKLAISEHPDRLDAARSLADSILEHTAPAIPDEIELLARLAVITGRCGTAVTLAHRLPTAAQSVQLPPSLLEKANEAFARWAAGCGGAEAFPAIANEAERAGASSRDALTGEYELLGAPIAMEYPTSAAAIRRLAGENDYVLRTEIHLLDGDTAAARRLLGRYRDARLVAPAGDLAADAIVSEARLWVAMGDTATAARMLDKLLSELRYVQPMVGTEQMLPNMLRLGAIGPAMELRSRISSDRKIKAKWASTLSALWAHADSPARLRANRLTESLQTDRR